MAEDLASSMTFARLFVALTVHGNLQTHFERQPPGPRVTFPGEALTRPEGPAVPTAGCYGGGLNVSVEGERGCHLAQPAACQGTGSAAQGQGAPAPGHVALTFCHLSCGCSPSASGRLTWTAA